MLEDSFDDAARIDGAKWRTEADVVPRGGYVQFGGEGPAEPVLELPEPPPPPSAPVQVTASALDVVVPASGEAVRYQRLLTRAGEPVVLALDTKKRRER